MVGVVRWCDVLAFSLGTCGESWFIFELAIPVQLLFPQNVGALTLTHTHTHTHVPSPLSSDFLLLATMQHIFRSECELHNKIQPFICTEMQEHACFFAFLCNYAT